MVEKMKYINIAGPMDDLDRVVDEYLSKYDIQLEDAVSELKNGDVASLQAPNPYSGVLRTAEKLIAAVHADDPAEPEDMSIPQAVEIITEFDKYYEEHNETIKALNTKRDHYLEYIELMDRLSNLDIELDKLSQFKFIGYRFGHMPINSFRQFAAFLYDDQDVLFIQGKTDGDQIWAVYFVPDDSKDKVDSILSSLHFERVWVPFELDDVKMIGTPAEICQKARERLNTLEEDIRRHAELSDTNVTPQQLLAAYQKVKEFSYHYDACKYAGRSSKDFYIFVGWMSEKDAGELEQRIQSDDKVVFIIEEDNEAIVSEAPTKLRNHPLIKPFEFFVRMYGLPSYGEIDPTPFVALSYTLVFGIMFGDLGQGAVLSAIGCYLYFRKKITLGAIMGIIGVSSMFFGCMYGSVFGMEELIPAVWIKPAHSINSILFFAVGLGIGMIAVAMLFNMLNSFRRKDWGSFFLSPNGLAGLSFYSAVIFTVYSVLTGSPANNLVIALFIVIPLVLMALREPITEKIQHNVKHTRRKLPQFLLETIIELFEVMLSYFTNTVSFVRVGAFALSHAGMMSVVLMLSESAEGHNPIVLIIGNIFVIALEGLVVGIQALRLEFYEMFSRFFNGGGREFVSYKRSKQL